MILILSNQFWVPLLQTQKRRNEIRIETNWLFYSIWLLQNKKIIVNCKFKMLPLSSHIISYDSFFHTNTNSKKLNPSKTQWYYVAIIRTIVYKHFLAKFPRRKRNEKLRQKKNMQQTFCLCFTSNIHLLHTQRIGGQLTAVPKPKANNGIRVQAHHQTSQELFFIVSLIIFGKRKVFLFSGLGLNAKRRWWIIRCM